MSFARRILIVALIVQIAGLLREIVFAVGVERYLAGLVSLADPSLVLATVVLVGALALLAPVWLGNRWATLLSVPLFALLLVGALPVAAPMFAAPSASNFAIWLTLTILLVSGAVGLVFGVAATLESFGRKPASPAIVGSHFSLAAVAVAGVLGSVIGMTVLGAAVAAAPSEGNGSVAGRPDAYATVVMRDLRFEPADIQLAGGQTTALFVVNEDGFDHSFDIDELDLHVMVPAGQTKVVMVSVPAAGEYTLYCGIPGHTESGMVGRLVSD